MYVHNTLKTHNCNNHYAFRCTWSHTILPHCVQLLIKACFWARQWQACLPGNCMIARDWPSALIRGTNFCFCLPAELGWPVDIKPVTRVWPGCFGGLGSYAIWVESSWTGSILMDSSSCEVGDVLFAVMPKPGGGVTLPCTDDIHINIRKVSIPIHVHIVCLGLCYRLEA